VLIRMMLTTPRSDVSIVPPAADARTVAILANPFSGRGPNRRYVQRLTRVLDTVQLQPRVVWEPAEREAMLGDPTLPAWCRCLVSAGGDGSLADVINDLHRHNPASLATLPLATLPIGNENLFARQFGFTREPGRLAEAIVRGTTRMVDIGKVGDRLFTLMASAGFDADVVHRVALWRRSPTPSVGAGRAGSPVKLKRVSKLSYVGKIASTLRDYDYPSITVEADGVTVRGAHVFVFNLPQYGANLGIARHARGDDAMLDYIVFERPGLMRLADYALAVIRTRHLGRPDVPHGKARRLRITSEATVPLQADGDPAGCTPIDVTVQPAAVRVIAMD
jgi:diacylglycerol kinase (ATP)